MKQFKIKLFPAANSACEKAVLTAALQNSGTLPPSLEVIAMYAEDETHKNPACSPTTITFIDDNTLVLDVKHEGNYEQGCIIEQVEVFEMEEIGALID